MAEKEFSKEFSEKALHDLKFIKNATFMLDSTSQIQEMSENAVTKNIEYRNDRMSNLNKYRSETTLISRVAFDLERLEGCGQDYGINAIAASARAELDRLVKKGLSFDEIIEIEKGKKPKVDLDGSSKQSFFAKLKNKAKKIFKGSVKDYYKEYMESQIVELKIALHKKPDLLKNFIYGRGGEESFAEVVKNQRKMDKYLSNEIGEIDADILSRNQALKENKEYLDKSQKTVDDINQVRDNAAKEIELRSTARENIGLTDAQSNTGIDKLAERAEAMKNMTPQQRLAYRMAELRGTSKAESAKPVQKREINSKIMPIRSAVRN